MSIDVTVVVPVYNPGRYIEACIDGYLSQTMPADQREIIFVDDGSTDETPARLDRLAAEHPDIHVIHQPNSGWPGKPRNVGLDAAAGEYVFFCDHDDWLSPQALTRMVATARRNSSDVLVPKMVGHKRGVPRAIFRRSLDQAVFGEAPLLVSLTVHKLFRRSFLTDHNLRFPEGPRRLEDLVFMMQAYLNADVISVMADYPSYHRTRRDDDGNAAFQRWTAAYYFQFVAETIDAIDALTEPGERRNTALMRPYVAEMMGKLTGKRLASWDPELRQEIFDEVRKLALERFPAGFHDTLPIARRAHARAVVTDRMDQLTEVAKLTASPIPRTVLHSLTWADNGWVADVEAEIVHHDGSPILLTPSGEDWSIDPRLIPTELDSGPYPLEQILKGSSDLLLRHRVSDVEWYSESSILPELVKVDGDPNGAHRLIYRGTAEIDPATFAGGRPLTPGGWDVIVHVDAFGMFRQARPKVQGGARLLAPRALMIKSRRIVSPRRDPAKRSAFIQVLRVAGPRLRLAAAALRNARDPVVTSTGSLVATIDLALTQHGTPAPCRAVLVGGAKLAPRRLGRLNAAAVGPLLAAKLRRKA